VAIEMVKIETVKSSWKSRKFSRFWVT